jgi:hypothetical protein
MNRITLTGPDEQPIIIKSARVPMTAAAFALPAFAVFGRRS